MKAIHQILDEENRNGILKILLKGKDFYQRLGWQNSRDTQALGIRTKDNISPHALRRVVDMVKANLRNSRLKRHRRG